MRILIKLQFVVTPQSFYPIRILGERMRVPFLGCNKNCLQRISFSLRTRWTLETYEMRRCNNLLRAVEGGKKQRARIAHKMPAH